MLGKENHMKLQKQSLRWRKKEGLRRDEGEGDVSYLIKSDSLYFLAFALSPLVDFSFTFSLAKAKAKVKVTEGNEKAKEKSTKGNKAKAKK